MHMTLPTTATIREAQLGDLMQMLQFQIAMAAESEGLILHAETLKSGIEAVFNNPTLGRYWVIEAASSTASNTLLGMCLITPEWSDWRNQSIWWLQSVYIVPEARGLGHLQSLTEHIAKAASKEGIAELRLYVATENNRARAAYRKLHFQDSHYHFMQRPLHAGGTP